MILVIVLRLVNGVAGKVCWGYVNMQILNCGASVRENNRDREREIIIPGKWNFKRELTVA